MERRGSVAAYGTGGVQLSADSHAFWCAFHDGGPTCTGGEAARNASPKEGSGKATELTGQHPQCEFNTVKDRLVFSTVYLGLQVLNDTRLVLTRDDMQLAGKTLHETVRACAEKS